MSTVANPTVRGVSLSSPAANEFQSACVPAAGALCQKLPKNISEAERLASTVGGVALALCGISRGRLLGLAATGTGAALIYRGVTGHCHLYDALGVNTAEQGVATAVPAQQGVHVDKSVTINRSARELFDFWRDVENLPQVLQHIESIEKSSDRLSHWVASGLLNTKFEWQAEIFNERDAEFIAWRSLPGGDVETAGSIHFKPLAHSRGTVVHVSMKYNPPGGKISDRVASFFGHGLAQQLATDLQRFKSLMETGEIPTTTGRPSGRTECEKQGANS